MAQKKAPASAAELSEEELELLELRQRVLIPIANQHRPSKAMTEAAAQEAGLSYSMARRLIQRYRETNDPLSFLPRRTGRNKGSRGLRRVVEEVINDAIERRFATRQKPSVESVYRDIRLACHQREIPVPSLTTVRRRFAEADPELLARQREGRKAVRQLKPSSGSQMPADYPLHVIQMDHTKADVIIVDSVNRKPIGRPFITLAIDLYSRCIAGYYISLEAPSATTVGLCLANVAQDKDTVLLNHQIKASWPLAGKPGVLHTDNGKEFHSRALRQGCLTHGIRLQYRPVGRPWFGGTVERVIGTFMSRMHDEVPGTTFSNVLERGEYQSEDEACMTLRELEHWLLLQITEYHATIHKGIGEPPLKRLLYGLSEVRKPEPIKDPKTYLLDFLPLVLRQIRRDGFHIDHISYYDPKLDYYIARRDQFDRFELRRDPRNLRFIWMRKPDEPGYMEIPYRRLTNPDLTLWEHREALRILKEANARYIDEDLIMKTVADRREAVRKARLTTKRARRNAERLREQGPHVGSRQPAAPPSPPKKRKPKKDLKPYDVEFSWDV